MMISGEVDACMRCYSSSCLFLHDKGYIAAAFVVGLICCLWFDFFFQEVSFRSGVPPSPPPSPLTICNNLHSTYSSSRHRICRSPRKDSQNENEFLRNISNHISPTLTQTTAYTCAAASQATAVTASFVDGCSGQTRVFFFSCCLGLGLRWMC